MKYFYFISAILLTAFKVQAYIPPVSFILDSVSKNQGRGVYAINLDLYFQAGSEKVVINENWLIENGSSMSLSAKGPGIKIDNIYKDNQRITMDEAGSKKSSGLTVESFESLFHLRNSSQLTRVLLASGMLPHKALQPLRIKNIKDFKPTSDPFARLTRMGGSIAYTFSEPLALNATGPTAAIWIEQDQFTIRKVRWSTQAELTADDYSNFSKDLSYPRSREIRWGSNSVKILTRRVDAKVENSSIQAQLSMSALSGKRNSFSNSETEVYKIIREFYSRFR